MPQGPGLAMGIRGFGLASRRSHKGSQGAKTCVRKPLRCPGEANPGRAGLQSEQQDQPEAEFSSRPFAVSERAPGPSWARAT